jgi:hypothetical protein
MKILHIKPTASGAPTNQGILFLIEPLISPHKQLSKYYTLLIASPYLDGASAALKVLDDELGRRSCQAFVIMLTDQHTFSGTSKAMSTLVSSGFKNLYGVAFDTGTCPRDLTMHVKLYAAWQYCPSRKELKENIVQLSASAARDRLVSLITKGETVGEMNAMYTPIFTALGSANFTADAQVIGTQHEVMVQSEDSDFCDECRTIFGEILQSYTSPEMYLFGI